MTGHAHSVVVIGGGYAGTARGQPSADARRRRHHPGQSAAEVRRADPAAPVRGRQLRRDGRLRHAARRGRSNWSSTAPPASTPPRARWSWRRAARWTTTTSSTRSAAPARRRHRCPARPNSPIPSRNSSCAQRLRDAIDELHPDAPVTVVGAGLTGIETAAELAEQGRSGHAGVRRVSWPRRCPSRAAGRSPSGWPSTASPCSRPTWWPRSGRTRSSSPTVRCARARSPSGRPVSACRSWPPTSGLRTDALGRLLTDETLTSVDDDASWPRATAPHRRASRCG